MALTLRLTDAEVALLKVMAQLKTVCADKAEIKAATSILAKIDRAELKAQTKANASGVSIKEAVAAFTEVLGRRLILPLQGQYAQLGVQLARLQLSREQCTAIAKAAAAEWRPGPIRVLSLVRQADVLLGSEGNPYKSEPLGGWQGAAPLDE